MPKEYFVLKGDPPATVDYEPGFYEREVAEKYAHDSAKRNPGTLYTVVVLETAYKFPVE